MSMNLYARVNKQRIELWQTPTSITYMCMMDTDGVHSEFTGAKAKRALRCYLEWVMSTLNGVWDDPKAYERAKATTMAHAKEIKDVLAAKCKLETYYM